MKLIADSGSTKTSWIVLDRDTVISTHATCGLNPYFHSSESIGKVIKSDLSPYLSDFQIDEIHFYGAGCSTDHNNLMISSALKASFGNARIFVYHDILGAGRALFGHNAGIACILGTGCNSCYYDGIISHSTIDSLGYLFGDEGAGSYLGKNFMAAYLKKELPADLRQAFDRQYHYSLEDILNSLYNKPSPNKFLASFSHFLSPNREHPFVQSLLVQSFKAFFEAHIRKYENYQSTAIGFIGSIASCYKEFLIDLAYKEGLNIAKIISSPSEGLVDYHKIKND